MEPAVPGFEQGLGVALACLVGCRVAGEALEHVAVQGDFQILDVGCGGGKTVAKLCDRVGIINKGRLLAEGTPEELREKTGDQSLESVFLEMTENTGKDPA